MKIFASYPKVMIIDTTEMTYRTGICETSHLRLFLDAKVQPLDLHDLGPSVPLKRSWDRSYFKTVIDFTGKQQIFM